MARIRATTIQQFNKLKKIEIGNTKGKAMSAAIVNIEAEFTQAVETFMLVDYDIMDIEKKQFADDFFKFRITRKQDEDVNIEEPSPIAELREEHRRLGAEVSRLRQQGPARKVIYLGARLDVRTQLRMEGYYQAMADFGLTGQHLLTEQSSSFTLGGELLAQAMARFPHLDGLFCTNDDLAVGALLQCQARWIPVPQQVAIAGSNALDIGHATPGPYF